MSEQSEAGSGCLGMVIGAIFAGTLSLALSEGCRDAQWHEELIRRGYAEYNSQNGKWQWKEPRTDHPTPSERQLNVEGVPGEADSK